MSKHTDKTGVFRKVAECLYRYSNGVYYARIKADGKEIRQSLKTTDRQTANRELAALKRKHRQVDRSQGKITLTELCDRYIKTVQHQGEKTVNQKSGSLTGSKSIGREEALFRSARSNRVTLICGWRVIALAWHHVTFIFRYSKTCLISHSGTRCFPNRLPRT
jgi:hypothetical protein